MSVQSLKISQGAAWVVRHAMTSLSKAVQFQQGVCGQIPTQFSENIVAGLQQASDELFKCSNSVMLEETFLMVQNQNCKSFKLFFTLMQEEVFS